MRLDMEVQMLDMIATESGQREAGMAYRVGASGADRACRARSRGMMVLAARLGVRGKGKRCCGKRVDDLVREGRGRDGTVWKGRR